MNDSDQDQKHDFHTPERQERIRLIKEAIELKATKLYGPLEERKRKNREHVDKLAAVHSEPVVRSILKVLSQAGDYVFAEFLHRHDLEHVDLNEVIRLYDLNGPRIDIQQDKDRRYEVVVAGGWHDAGEIWEGSVWQEGEEWRFERTSYCEF